MMINVRTLRMRIFSFFPLLYHHFSSMTRTLDFAEKTEIVTEIDFVDSIMEEAEASSTPTSSKRRDNMRDSLLLDINNTVSEKNNAKNAIIEKLSINKKRRSGFDCRLYFSKVGKFIKRRMAFKPEIPDDPRLFSPKKKRLILACLACGSSLNGFCSTVYVRREKSPLHLL